MEFNLLKENGIIVCEFSNHEDIQYEPFQLKALSLWFNRYFVT